MLKESVLKYFDPVGSKPIVTARALGLTPGAISQWGEIIPELQARRISELSKGKMKFRAELYERRPASA